MRVLCGHALVFGRGGASLALSMRAVRLVVAVPPGWWEWVGGVLGVSPEPARALFSWSGQLACFYVAGGKASLRTARICRGA